VQTHKIFLRCSHILLTPSLDPVVLPFDASVAIDPEHVNIFLSPLTVGLMRAQYLALVNFIEIWTVPPAHSPHPAAERALAMEVC
jgi:hypothetical protein